MDRVEPHSTADVRAWLARLGFAASQLQIENDTRDRFLPHRPPGSAGTSTHTGLWDSWMMRRAERLYRLRSIRDPDGRPALSGDALRIILFLGDGWGWSHDVRDLALRGFDKSVAATLADVRRFTKRKNRSNEQIAFALESHDRNPTSAEKYAIGMLQNAEPLDGGTLAHLFEKAQGAGLLGDLFAGRSGREMQLFAQGLMGSMFTQGELDFAGAFRHAIANLSDEAAATAIPEFHKFNARWRGFIHRSAIAEGTRSPTNLVTMCGRRQREIERGFRESRAPNRITPAQSLAMFVGIGLVVDAILPSAEMLILLPLITAFSHLQGASVRGAAPPRSK